MSPLKSVAGGVETLRWRDSRIELIDQRLLPTRLEYLAYDSAAGIAQAIRDMVIRGAPAIGCAAAYGVAVEARRLQDVAPQQFTRAMEEAFAILAASRPTAINLFWALKLMREVWAANERAAPAKIAEHLLNKAHKILAADIETNRTLGRYGSELLGETTRILTHCNAGALATAGHGTALGVIRSAVTAGKHVSVIACETRPYLQGARLTAWELKQDGIPVTVITDNMAGHIMSRGEVDAIIVGADRIAANGDFANKIGTYPLAVLAQRHRLPFYVAAPLSTIDLNTSHGDQIPIEERPATEVHGFSNVRWTPEEVAVRNPAFDVTPAELVTALITEKGVLHRPNVRGIAALFTSAAPSKIS